MADTSPIDNFDSTENMETKALTLLSEKFPDLDCGPGTPVYEMVVRPIAYLWTHQLAGIDELINSLSFTNYSTMPMKDLDRLMNRYFLTRKTGVVVSGTVRCITSGQDDVFIYAGEIWETPDGRTYQVMSNCIVKKDEWEDIDSEGNYLHKYRESEVSPWIYYMDVPVESTATGSDYNANQNDQILPTGIASEYITAAYFLTTTNDGGSDETNYDFYQRAKDELAFRGMCSYKSSTALLRDNFPEIGQVVSVGLKDSEMIRDLAVINTAKSSREIGETIRTLVYNIYGITIPYDKTSITDVEKIESLGSQADAQAVNNATIHLGGKCDIYVQPTRYFPEEGYFAPLGFPLEYQTLALKDTPSQLRALWNASLGSFKLADKGKRGSLQESITGLDETIITNLKSDITEITEFVESGEESSLHTDNLVKQMWPIVVTGTITIESDDSDTDITLAKTTVSTYINSLKTTEAPQVAELAHILREVGIKSVHVPMQLYAYYLTDDLHMEYFGLELEKSSTSLLIPTEKDSLQFTIPENKTSQISIRTCTWYSNNDLINIEVAS